MALADLSLGREDGVPWLFFVCLCISMYVTSVTSVSLNSASISWRCLGLTLTSCQTGSRPCTDNVAELEPCNEPGPKILDFWMTFHHVPTGKAKLAKSWILCILQKQPLMYCTDNHFAGSIALKPAATTANGASEAYVQQVVRLFVVIWQCVVPRPSHENEKKPFGFSMSLPGAPRTGHTGVVVPSVEVRGQPPTAWSLVVRRASCEENCPIICS